MIADFYERLSNDLIQLLENPMDYNTTIEVGETPNNQIFKVHSYILLSRCPYFKKKLEETSLNENNVKEIKVSNISVKVFSIIIKYIYSGRISLENLESSIIYDLLISSLDFDIDELVEYLQTHLITNDSSWLKSNFAHVYQTSQNKNFEIIRKFCNNLIAKQPDTIFVSGNFESLPEDTLISIIQLDDLQLEEDMIWDYVIQWGRAKHPTFPINLNEWTSENFLTLKATLKNCLPHIRYFNFTSERIVEKLYPYLHLFESQLWLEINAKFLAPNKPITSTILPPRKILIPSNIINSEHALEISTWIDKRKIPYTDKNPYEFELLVRGSRDGFDVKTILEICNKVSNTITVVKVEGTGEIIGGYNPLEIYNNINGNWYNSQDSFAFSMKTENQRFSVISRVNDYNVAIYYDSRNMYLQFGNVLNLRGNLKTSKYSYCGALYYEGPIRSNTSGFSAEEVEVFKVSPKK